MDSKEVDELNSLYGDVETTGLDNQTYQWSGEQNTVLQMVVSSKNDEKATVILSVASFEYSIDHSVSFSLGACEKKHKFNFLKELYTNVE